MNMINLDMYAMRQMRNYRLRVKFHNWPLCGVCHVTVRTTLFDAIEAYTYTTEDIEKYGASELIRQSISKFVETHDRELFTAIYNDETASLSQRIRDIIQVLKLHYTISYTIHGRNYTVWSDLFNCRATYNYAVTRSNRVMTNTQVIEDAIRTFYNSNNNIFNKEETTMENKKNINVMEELSSWMEAYDIRDRECRKLSERLLHEASENGALKKTIKMLKDAISKRDEELKNLIKKNESLSEDINMYQHHLMECNVDNEKLIKKNKSLSESIDSYQHCLVKTTDENEKLKDEIQTRMNNENLDKVRIADLEETVKMLRETIRRKDMTIQNDAEAFKEEINRLKSDCDALNKKNIRLCKRRLNEVYGFEFLGRNEEMIYPKLARILAKNGEHFTIERDFILWNIVRAALDGKTHHTFCAELSMDTITSLMALGYDITYNSTDHGTTVDISWEE